MAAPRNENRPSSPTHDAGVDEEARPCERGYSEMELTLQRHEHLLERAPTSNGLLPVIDLVPAVGDDDRVRDVRPLRRDPARTRGRELFERRPERRLRCSQDNDCSIRREAERDGPGARVERAAG